GTARRAGRRRALAATSQLVSERHADVAGIAEPHVELLRKVGRLVAEEEAAHCVLLVEEVARPKLDADPAEVAADLEVHERVVVRLLVVRIVEVEGVAAGELEPPEPAGIVPVLRADRVAPARRMRLLPALERRIHGELDDLRVEKAEPAEELQVLCRQPIDARLDPAMPPLLGVLREEQERRRVAETELKRDLDLLVVAPRLEKADVRAQPAVEPSAFDARLE